MAVNIKTSVHGLLFNNRLRIDVISQANKLSLACAIGVRLKLTK
jgi:hypothetical protein